MLSAFPPPPHESLRRPVDGPLPGWLHFHVKCPPAVSSSLVPHDSFFVQYHPPFGFIGDKRHVEGRVSLPIGTTGTWSVQTRHGEG